MHHSTKAFYDAFSTKEKNDFYGGYLYLKYINQFASIACKAIGLPYKEIVHHRGVRKQTFTIPRL